MYGPFQNRAEKETVRSILGGRIFQSPRGGAILEALIALTVLAIALLVALMARVTLMQEDLYHTARLSASSLVRQTGMSFQSDIITNGFVTNSKIETGQESSLTVILSTNSTYQFSRADIAATVDSFQDKDETFAYGSRVKLLPYYPPGFTPSHPGEDGGLWPGPAKLQLKLTADRPEWGTVKFEKTTIESTADNAEITNSGSYGSEIPVRAEPTTTTVTWPDGKKTTHTPTFIGWENEEGARFSVDPTINIKMYDDREITARFEY